MAIRDARGVKAAPRVTVVGRFATTRAGGATDVVGVAVRRAMAERGPTRPSCGSPAASVRVVVVRPAVGALPRTSSHIFTPAARWTHDASHWGRREKKNTTTRSRLHQCLR